VKCGPCGLVMTHQVHMQHICIVKSMNPHVIIDLTTVPAHTIIDLTSDEEEQ
jgi:hypothetical protein